MKTYARFLAMLLATLMIASAAFVASAADFSDVADNHKYANAINVLAKLGVIGGYEDGTFKPDNKVERDEMAKLIFVLKTTLKDAGTGASQFTDTTNSWANGFISYCYAEGIIGGHGDGTFRPDDYVTYDQALKMACAALGYTDFDSALWPTDVRLVGIKQLKLNKGLPADLNGSDELTRGQVAQILYNALFAVMAETRTESVQIPGTGYFMPVEVNMYLASDVWAFEQVDGTIVATEDLYLADKASTLAAADKVVVEDATGAEATFTLAELGLSDYASKGYELIGRNISLYTLEGELIEASANLKGAYTANATIKTVLKSDNKTADRANLEVDGTKYAINKVWYTVGTNGAVALATGDTVYDMVYSVSYSHKEYFNATVDADGNGKIDYLFVIPSELYEVAEVKDSKVNLDAIYAVGGDITGKKQAEIIADVEYAKGDVVIANAFGKYLVITDKVAPVETYIVRANGSQRYLANNANSIKYTLYNTVSPFYGHDKSKVEVPASVGKDTTANYYLVGNVIVYSKAVATGDTTPAAALANTAVLVSAQGETEWTYDESTGKYVRYYPVTLSIDGSATTVNVSKINDKNVRTEEGLALYTPYIGKINPDGTFTATESNDLVAYTVDKNGEYELYVGVALTNYLTDYVAANKVDDAINAPNSTIEVTSTGFYKTNDGVLFELDENSILYYVNDKGVLKYYTAETMPEYSKLSGTFVGVAYFADASEYVKTLAVGFLNGAIKDETGAPVVKTGAADPANHLFFLGDDEGIILGSDGKSAHYVYRYIKLATGELVETYSPTAVDDKNNPAIKMQNGDIAAYKSDNKTLEVIVDENNYDKTLANNTIVKENIEGFYEASSLMFTASKGTGVSIANAKILYVKGTNAEWTSVEAKTMADLVKTFTDNTKKEVATEIVYGIDASGNIDYILYFAESYTMNNK